MQHSGRLIELIADAINQNDGIMPFNDFMQRLLYQPGLGYYSAGLSKFGKAGDFVTAPEISPLFGRSLGTQCQQLIDRGCKPCILEFGAGSGKLCEQVVGKLNDLESYYILELSADLRARQQAYLKQQLDNDIYQRISWLDYLPEAFNGIVLANEVLDAMPVHRLQKKEKWIELGVGFDGEKFCWQDYANDSDAIRAIEIIEQQFGPYASGYTTEVNLNYSPWLKALGEAAQQVAVLLIDYGYEQSQYYHPQRTQGTMLCHYHHRAHDDVFILPGLQDVTAWVDFDAVAVAALANGFDIAGLVTQSQFLLANGLLDEVELNHSAADTLAQLDIAQQIKTLTLPGEMGEKFKVIGLTKNIDIEMTAFQGRR